MYVSRTNVMRCEVQLTEDEPGTNRKDIHCSRSQGKWSLLSVGSIQSPHLEGCGGD